MEWMRCKICGYQSKHPDGRGLHKHVRHAHGLSAWDYYQLYLDALQQRIEAKVDLVRHVPRLGKCWVFRGRPTQPGRFGSNRRGAGYRDMRIAGAPTTAVHKLSVFAYTGYMPLRSEVVIHRCDNPGCCNPHHVYAGTQRENVYDRQRKGRQCQGVRHPRAALTESQVHQIRDQTSWRSNREIADELGVDIEVVRRCAKFETYTNVLPQEIPF